MCSSYKSRAKTAYQYLSNSDAVFKACLVVLEYEKIALTLKKTLKGQRTCENLDFVGSLGEFS